MQRIRMSTKALAALGLAGALAADASVASAQTGGGGKPPSPSPSSRPAQPGKDQPTSEDKTTPKPPEATAPAKTAESRPGPLDVVVQFQGNSAEIDAGVNASLDQLADWLKQDPTRSITIEVHPNDLSRADLDGAITDERADATKRYLVAQGVVETQIRVMTSGTSSAPVGPTDRNRRTVFIMTLGTGVATGTPPPAEQHVAAPPVEPIPVVEPVPVPEREPERAHLLTPFGMAVTIGGGAMGFLDGEARDLAGVGGAWEARLTVGTRTPLAFEAAYVGSAQGIDALGLDRSAVLLGSTVEGDLRLNFTTTFLQPYIFGGIGYTHYDVINEDFNTSSVNDSESMGEIPFGAGLGFQWRGLLFDVRGTMRAAFNDDLVNEPGTEDDPLNENDTQTDLDTWTAAARVGWEF